MGAREIGVYPHGGPGTDMAGKGRPRLPRKRSPMPPPGRIFDEGMRRPEEGNEWRSEVLETEGERRMESPGAQEKRLRIRSGEVNMEALLNDTDTAQKIWEALPIESRAKTWGDEVYFDIPVAAEEEDAQAHVPPGTLAYWPPGAAFCIFFGQTPYSPVNVVGALQGDPNAFKAVKDGDQIILERATA